MANVIEEKIAKGALVIDVRSVDEYQDECFKGALNIPVNSLLARLDELGDKNRSIVLYCASGGRSSVAAMMLKQSGFTDVVNAGGLYDMPGYE